MLFVAVISITCRHARVSPTGKLVIIAAKLDGCALTSTKMTV